MVTIMTKTDPSAKKTKANMFRRDKLVSGLIKANMGVHIFSWLMSAREDLRPSLHLPLIDFLHPDYIQIFVKCLSLTLAVSLYSYTNSAMDMGTCEWSEEETKYFLSIRLEKMHKSNLANHITTDQFTNQLVN